MSSPQWFTGFTARHMEKKQGKDFMNYFFFNYTPYPLGNPLLFQLLEWWLYHFHLKNRIETDAGDAFWRTNKKKLSCKPS